MEINTQEILLTEDNKYAMNDIRINERLDKMLNKKEKEIKEKLDDIINLYNQIKWDHIKSELEKITDEELEQFSLMPELNEEYNKLKALSIKLPVTIKILRGTRRLNKINSIVETNTKKKRYNRTQIITNDNKKDYCLNCGNLQVFNQSYKEKIASKRKEIINELIKNPDKWNNLINNKLKSRQLKDQITESNKLINNILFSLSSVCLTPPACLKKGYLAEESRKIILNQSEGLFKILNESKSITQKINEELKGYHSLEEEYLETSSLNRSIKEKIRIIKTIKSEKVLPENLSLKDLQHYNSCLNDLYIFEANLLKLDKKTYNLKELYESLDQCIKAPNEYYNDLKKTLSGIKTNDPKIKKTIKNTLIKCKEIKDNAKDIMLAKRIEERIKYSLSNLIRDYENWQGRIKTNEEQLESLIKKSTGSMKKTTSSTHASQYLHKNS